MKRLLLVLGLCLALVLPGWAQSVKPREGNAFSFNKKKFAAIYLPRLLSDRFITPRAAGAVNGTAAEPGPGGNRTVVDATNLISIAGGKLTFAGGTSNWADAGLFYAVGVSRVPGKLFIGNINKSVGTTVAALGYNSASALNFTNWNNVVDFDFDGANRVIKSVENGFAANRVTGLWNINTDYFVVIAARAAGAFYFIKGGAFTNWTLLDVIALGNAATLYPVIQSYDAAMTSMLMAVPTVLWLPTPLASDGFGSAFGTTDGLGHAEGVAGGLGSGGAGKVWTTKAGTWQTAAGKASASALTGGLAIATVDAGTANIFGICDLTRTAGSAGNIWRYIDADNYLFSYTEGTNFILKQRLATVETTIVTGAVTYGAGKTGVVTLDGTAARVYYDNALVGTGTVDAAFTAATLHGLYTTNTGNTFDNLCIYARGNEGQYNMLDVFAQ